MTIAVECVVPAANLLGESPVWCDRMSRLYWVDSRGPAIHWLDQGGRAGSLPASELIGSIGLCLEPGRLVAAMATGFFLVDVETGRIDRFGMTDVVEPGHRFNDGRVDRQGRFWAGTMNDGARVPTGALYRLDGNGRIIKVLDQVIVPNSLAWSPDARTMYFADTYRYQIWSFPFAAEEGRLGERRTFADLTGQVGRPDGSAVDAEGCLWNAEYAGGRVVRYAPDGRVDRVVSMPVSNPTCCAFGGSELDTLFVTSARQRLTPEQLGREPLAGSVFAIRPGVSGLPEPRFEVRS